MHVPQLLVIFYSLGDIGERRMVLSITQTKQVFQGTYKERHTPNLSHRLHKEYPQIFCVSADFYRPPSEGWGKVIVSVCSHFGEGGSQVSDFRGGAQVSDFRGGSMVSDFQGGVRSQIFRGVPGLRFLGGGPRSQIFRGGPRSQIFGEVSGLRFSGGYPVSVKGKIFDTRFDLIHVKAGEKIFVEAAPLSKGKNF